MPDTTNDILCQTVKNFAISAVKPPRRSISVIHPDRFTEIATGWTLSKIVFKIKRPVLHEGQGAIRKAGGVIIESDSVYDRMIRIMGRSAK